ncbi:MAG: cytosine deaminase, partial [Aquimonas sp.]|nr:cytosine deaminase [Aquimonas sp.]
MSALDLILRGANLADGRRGIDIGIQQGCIVAIAPNLQAEARDVLHVEGCLVSAPFVDAHFHMDATLSLGLPRL